MQEYVCFLDESGDHNLANIDNNFPVFCLVGCVFEKEFYNEVARPAIDAFKLRFWGRTDVILHSRDIRKRQKEFSFLADISCRSEFYSALNGLISELEFTIISVTILKEYYRNQYGDEAKHPYHLALSFIMERFQMALRRGDAGKIIAESRGRREDGKLRDEFERLKSEDSRLGGFDNVIGLWMEKKQANVAGLQIADLAAYPIAAKVLRPAQPQKSFNVLNAKLKRSHDKGILGYGLKIFPQPTFEHLELWGK